MLHKIHTSAHFASSGARMAGIFQPKTGLTAVVGENGVGKTFQTIEATRWLLYGKAALRGMASDYKDSSALGELSIRGARYEISRGKQEWLKNAEGVVLAKGAEQVTAYVTELMGYGLEVFDICNAATQGNVQMLSKMRPAARKAIIDQVLRLTSAEAAEKMCREDAAGFRREVEALTKVLRTPREEPAAPEGYAPSAQLHEQVKAMRALLGAHTALRARLQTVVAPDHPADLPRFSEAEIEALEAHERERGLTETLRGMLTAKVASYTPTNVLTEDEIELAEARWEWEQEVAARGPRPTLPKAKAEELKAEWDEIAAVKRLSDEKATCPKCAHTFRVGGEIPIAPSVDLIEVNIQLEAHRKWATPLPAEPTAIYGSLSLAASGAARRELAKKLVIDDAKRHLAELPDLEDRSEELRIMHAAKADMESFLKQRLHYERVCQANADVLAQIAALDPCPRQDEIDDLLDAAWRAEVYETACREYDREVAAYKDVQKRIADAQFLAEEYKLGAQGLADARAKVKALIAPHISQIASVLINDMTMGKLKSLVVTEDMEIVVDGQRIETLSGAGLTVANLALRIAMGQALVGRVFPVFLADEIDGDLSASRREATLQALVGLKKHLSQIVLVTHRGAEVADHTYTVL